eukprot:Opistho-2@68016
MALLSIRCRCRWRWPGMSMVPDVADFAMFRERLRESVYTMRIIGTVLAYHAAESFPESRMLDDEAFTDVFWDAFEIARNGTSWQESKTTTISCMAQPHVLCVDT